MSQLGYTWSYGDDSMTEQKKTPTSVLNVNNEFEYSKP